MEKPQRQRADASLQFLMSLQPWSRAPLATHHPGAGAPPLLM